MPYWTLATVLQTIQTIGAAVSVGVAIAGASSANRAKKRAEAQRLDRNRELKAQQKEVEIDAKRQVRVQKARLLARQAASGAILSLTSAGIIGLDTSYDQGVTDLARRTDFNISSVNSQADALKAEATTNQINALVTMSASAVNFTDLLNKNMTPDTQTQEQTTTPSQELELGLPMRGIE